MLKPFVCKDLLIRYFLRVAVAQVAQKRRPRRNFRPSLPPVSYSHFPFVVYAHQESAEKTGLSTPITESFWQLWV
jgi:hypothetical protein